MREWVQKLIYRKWFYGFLMLALWVDSWTDFVGLRASYSSRELVSLVLSTAGAVLVTLVFVDLQSRWPPRAD